MDLLLLLRYLETRSRPLEALGTQIEIAKKLKQFGLSFYLKSGKIAKIRKDRERYKVGSGEIACGAQIFFFQTKTNPKNEKKLEEFTACILEFFKSAK